MKKLLFLLLLIPFLGTSQGTFTAPVGYNTGTPTAAPSGVGTRWRFDLLTGKKYTWLPGSLTWDEDPRGIDQISGCSAPLYTPGYNQSVFAVNSCTIPELYQWTGSVWVKLNSGQTYTAGTGIAVSGGNVISNTGDLSATNELNIALYVDAGSLKLDDPGGTISMPLTQLRTIYTEGTGIDITSGVISNTAPDQTVAMTDGAGIDVAGTYPNFTVTNTSPNVTQTLSIAGNELTLSDGGGTVELPGGASGALGIGFVDGGGTGSVPTTTSVEITDFLGFGHGIPAGWESGLPFDYTSNYDYVRWAGGQFGFRGQNDGGQSIDFIIGVADGFNSTFVNGTLTGIFSGGAGGGAIGSSNSDGSEKACLMSANFTEGELSVSDPQNRGNGKFKVERGRAIMSAFKDAVNVEMFADPDDGVVLTSEQTDFLGLQYGAEYPAILNSPTSAPYMKLFTDGLVPNINRQVSDSDALNGETFYSTDRSKLCYKDPGGTVNELY